MRYIGADLARLDDADHGVEVRAVQINLAAGAMYDVAYLTD